MIRFVLPITGLAKQGDRSRVARSSTGRPFVMHYTSAEVRSHAATLEALMAEYRPSVPLRGPVAVHLCFRFAWRATEKRSVRALGVAYRDTKPDLDNLSKQVLDAIQRVGFVSGDQQVAVLQSQKLWSDQGSIEVAIFELGQARTEVA